MASTIDGGEALLDAFRKLGIDYVISSPGSEWAPVWEALARQKQEGKNGPAYIDCWHETLAVDMALGYTLVTRRPQVVLLHAGAGLLQGSMGIHGVMQAEAPMLVMSGESLTYGDEPGFDPGGQWVRNLSVVGGPHRLVEGLVKHANQVTSIHTLHEQVIRTTEIAARAPKGPTYLNIPLETMLEEWTPRGDGRLVPDAPLQVPTEADVRKLAQLLVKAKLPVVVTEAAGREAEGFAALVALADLLALPVVESGGLYANFPRSHPMYQGGNLKPFVDDMDVALCVDARVPWYPPSDAPKNATVVALGEAPQRGHMVYQSLGADMYLEGNVGATLALLAAAVREIGVDEAAVADRRARMTEAHDKVRAANAELQAKSRDKDVIDAVFLCATLNEIVPEGTIYVEELTTHGGITKRHLEWDAPRSFFTRQGGIGQGLGLALGVKLAQRDRTVIATIGDGSILYNPAIQSFGASRDYDLPILVIVFNNGKYLAMEQNHKSFYPDGVAKRTDTWHGVHINGPDYSQLGAPFGFFGRKVERPAELKPALQEALEAVSGGQTAILNVVLER